MRTYLNLGLERDLVKDLLLFQSCLLGANPDNVIESTNAALIELIWPFAKNSWDLLNNFDQSRPLLETELDRLKELLKSYEGGNAMNIEEVDGFFSALIAGPEVVNAGEYLPELFGSATPETHAFSTLAEANQILGLLVRHWNSIAGTLSRGEVYLPLLLKDENSLERGNDWARGFIRGTRLRFDGWAELLNDPEHGGCMIPMMMLYHEHDEDLSMRPKPIDRKQREKLYRVYGGWFIGSISVFQAV